MSMHLLTDKTRRQLVHVNAIKERSRLAQHPHKYLDSNDEAPPQTAVRLVHMPQFAVRLHLLLASVAGGTVVYVQPAQAGWTQFNPEPGRQGSISAPAPSIRCLEWCVPVHTSEPAHLRA